MTLWIYRNQAGCTQKVCKIPVSQNLFSVVSNPTVQSHQYHICKSDTNHLCPWAALCLMIVPFLFLEIISQILLREHGSTPVVGSSSITTLDPPRRAIAIDNFLFIPPDREPASLWRWLYRPVSFKVLWNKEKTPPKVVLQASFKSRECENTQTPPITASEKLLKYGVLSRMVTVQGMIHPVSSVTGTSI